MILFGKVNKSKKMLKSYKIIIFKAIIKSFQLIKKMFNKQMKPKT